MSQHVANDYGFVVAVCRMMSDKVSSVLSNFYFFFASASWALINNSWGKITVPEKGSLFHQAFHTLLINTYNFLMCNFPGVLKNREFVALLLRMLQQGLQENWDSHGNVLLGQRGIIQPAVGMMLLWIYLNFHQVIGEHMQNYTKWRKNEKEEN